MRNEFTQVETAEIADSDLDTVAGGIGAGLAVNGLDSVLPTVTGLADSVLPATQVLSTVLPGLPSVGAGGSLSVGGGLHL
jgi:hypothetical protein